MADRFLDGRRIRRWGERTPLSDLEEVVFPLELYWQVVAHARRKLAGEHRPGEEQASKAYGLIGARLLKHAAQATHVFPLRRNARDDPEVKEEIDRLMEAYAIRSETPLDRRGWVTDPWEFMLADQECERAGSVLLGSYHMHRVPWEHDPVRDKCTAIDRQLAERSGLWMFILSMVDPHRPILRAFFEGCNEREVTVRLAAPNEVVGLEARTSGADDPIQTRRHTTI